MTLLHTLWAFLMAVVLLATAYLALLVLPAVEGAFLVGYVGMVVHAASPRLLRWLGRVVR